MMQGAPKLGCGVMGIHPWVDGGHFPRLFEVEGTPCVSSADFVDGRHFLTARRYASAVLAVNVCLSVCLSVRPSVCPSVCLSQVGVVQRWLNLGSD